MRHERAQRSAAMRGDAGATAAAHTDPSATASADGLLPVLSRVITRGPPGSTRATVPSSPPAIHTAPSPTATAAGSRPTRDAATSPRSGPGRSARACRHGGWRPTPRPRPSPARSARCRRGSRWTTRRCAARSRVTVPGLLARHPQRAGAGGDRARLAAEGDRCARGPVAEVDPVDVAVGARGDPHAPSADRQRARRVADRRTAGTT